MKYRFDEAKLPMNFCQEYFKKAEEMIERGTSFTIIGMPAVSVSLFLKFLASQPLAYFIYIDMYALPTLSKNDFYNLLLQELGHNTISSPEENVLEACKTRLQALAKTHKKVVVIFNRFTEMQNEFDQSFFGSLRTLSHTANNISFIFSITKPYDQLSPEALAGGNLHMFTEYLYYKPLTEKDLLLLLSLHSPALISDSSSFKNAVVLSGGHLQLLQLLLKTERVTNPLRDPYIKILLKEIFYNVSPKQRKVLEKISLGKTVPSLDTYLLTSGYVKKQNNNYQLFSPLLREFIKQNSISKLSAKETRLFKLLKLHIGELVSKDTIFNTVWEDEMGNASDWALDSLIYRLRKNPTFQKTGFSIENHKKLGYMLVRE